MPSQQKPLTREKSRQALIEALEWIDQIPGSAPLPAMPGFDRDMVDALVERAIEDFDYFGPGSTEEQALTMVMGWALEWIEAVPTDIIESLGIKPYRA